MTNLINSQPRFGMEETGGVVRIFDYATNTYHTLEDDETEIESTDGVWNARKIADAIKTQRQVFDAFLGNRDPNASPDDIDEVEHGRSARISRTRIREHDETERSRQQRADKVEQVREDFLADGSGDSSPQRADDGLTEEERKQQQIDQTGEKVQDGASSEQQNGGEPRGEVVQSPSGETHHNVQGEQPQQ